MNIIVELAAKTAHEVNRAYSKTLGEDMPSWEDSSEAQRMSIRNGVKYVVQNPTITPKDQHIAWMQYKVKDGWKYGPVKNEVAKEHPCLVEYENLPAAQQVKDALFRATVSNILGLTS